MATDLFSGLIAWYPITPEDVFGVSGGLKDNSRQNANTIVYGSPEKCDGHDGSQNSGIRLNGTSSRFDIPSGSLVPEYDYTICVWLRMNVPISGRYVLYQGSPTTNNRVIAISERADTPQYVFYFNNTEVCTVAPTGGGGYDFYVIRRVGTQTEVLQNGVLKWSGSTYVGGIGGAVFRIGAGSSAAYGYGTSDVDNLRVYDRCLTDSEIRELFRDGETSLRDGLICWLPCVASDKDGAGIIVDAVRDYSGKALHADVINALKTVDADGTVGEAFAFEPQSGGSKLVIPGDARMTFGTGDFAAVFRVKPLTPWSGNSYLVFPVYNGNYIFYACQTWNSGEVQFGALDVYAYPVIALDEYSTLIINRYKGQLEFRAAGASVYSSANATVGNSVSEISIGGQGRSIGDYNSRSHANDVRIYNRGLTPEEVSAIETTDAWKFDFLVARWKMDGLETGVGNIIDSSQSRLHATTFVGTPTLVAGHDGTENKALSFPQGCYAKVPVTDLAKFKDRDWCVCAWIGVPAGQTDSRVNFFSYGYNFIAAFRINLSYTAATQTMVISQISSCVNSSDYLINLYSFVHPPMDVSDGRMHHICVARRGTALEVRIDGGELISYSGYPNPIGAHVFPDWDNNIYLAWDAAHTNWPNCQGQVVLEDVRIYTGYAPTQSEIQEIMTDGGGGGGEDPPEEPVVPRYGVTLNTPMVI